MQDIDENSIPGNVEAKIRAFIFTDSDGSKRVNVSGLTSYLAEQFSYQSPDNASHIAKSAMAASIAEKLQASIAREAFRTRDDYPKSPVAEINPEITSRLNDMRRALEAETRNIAAGYRTFIDGVNVMLKAVFAGPLTESITGVQLVNVTRAYVDTFVTDRGEESRPSAASALATLDQNDSATITCSAAPAGRHITKRRLYRSATTANNAVWRLQGEYPAEQTVIADDKPDSALNDVLTTTGWLEPPAGLQGLTGMSNGIMVGYVGSTLHACEPYVPYAWPAKYDKPLPHKIMGIASIGQSVLVGTTGFPYLVSGSDSMSLTEQKLATLVPCVSAASMVAVANSVFYASPDGLALYENGAVTVVTEGVIDRADWSEYNPASMRGAGFDGRYVGFYQKADATRGCFVFDYKSRTFSELAQAADAAFSNEAGLYVLDGTQLLNLLPLAGARRAGLWRSKVFRLVKPQAFMWLHIDSDFTSNGAPTGVTVRVFADGALHDTIVVTDKQPARLPPGRAHDWIVEVESAAIVNGVVLASTMTELKAVL
jgi:hypothetical protein